MDGLSWKILLKWMIWGYHYFWKHPYMGLLMCFSKWQSSSLLQKAYLILSIKIRWSILDLAPHWVTPGHFQSVKPCLLSLCTHLSRLLYNLPLKKHSLNKNDLQYACFGIESPPIWKTSQSPFFRIAKKQIGKLVVEPPMFNPSEKIWTSNWISSPIFGMNIKP